ncbi:MAG: G-D-S-L family lipolytic protein [Bacteroidetes bacterium]|nr:MAG: G-D-S-L family lipolytic protein [Bacteroidota bacterium]
MKNIFFGLIVCLLFGCSSHEPAATPAPFAKSIAAFKKQDSISFPPENAILFIGSSSFTLWEDVQNYFPGYTIINRGFGGSTLEDQIRYANDIIFPYKPKQIIIYCGENDLAFSDTVTAVMVFERFKHLYKMIREKTNAPVAYISMKPSPSRRHLFAKMREANLLIMEFIISQDPNAMIRSNMDPAPAVFIEVHSKMLNKEGEPFPEIFLDDSLHMNAKGYSIWQKEIQPYLLKD